MRAGHSWNAAGAFQHFPTLFKNLVQCPEAHVGTDCLQNKDGWSCVCSMADALGQVAKVWKLQATYWI